MFTKEKIKDFLGEITAVCKKHNMSISHEDSQGGFIVEEFDRDNIVWLMNASWRFPEVEVIKK